MITIRFGRNRITQRDANAVRKQTIETLCKWHDTINSWGDVPELDFSWGKRPIKWNRTCRGSQLSNFIRQVIGHKITLQYHNMGDDEFEDFWLNSAHITYSFMGCTYYFDAPKINYEDYMKRQLEKIKTKHYQHTINQQ